MNYYAVLLGAGEPLVLDSPHWDPSNAIDEAMEACLPGGHYTVVEAETLSQAEQKVSSAWERGLFD